MAQGGSSKNTCWIQQKNMLVPASASRDPWQSTIWRREAQHEQKLDHNQVDPWWVSVRKREGKRTIGEDAKEEEETKRNEWMCRSLREWIRKRLVAHQYSRASATGPMFGRCADYKRFPTIFGVPTGCSVKHGQTSNIVRSVCMSLRP